ncbi:Tigger transposable element-derived protein 1 [Chionoecetes opilio]|uniref:Tigger transposable element-derived protein 1 n=1 Tax=Chionoecetes opilio TaxID=41210 RepID=A0A8J4YDZ1_CHIOP|nr:Tigger transposable element-derived protein 1 [Chionoecetes opilio]
MSSKRSAPPTPGSSEKKRKVLSLAEKMDVLAVIDSGLGWSATGKKFGLHEATVRTIWKTREKIRQSVRESADVSSKVASVSRRDPLLEKMEKILNRWISEQVDQRKSNVDGVAIREKARSIYDHLAEKEPSGSSPAPGLLPAMGGSIDSSSVLACTTLLAQAWDEVKPSTLNARWYALWPECVNDFNGFPAVTQQMKDIVDLAHTVGGEGFSDMTEEDVAELIDSHGAEPSVEEIIQMNEDDQAGDDADEDDDTETRPVFTIMKLRNLLREADNLTELFTDQDPIQERSIKFKRVVDEGLIPYKETLRSMEASACQKPITAFFKPSPASTPAKKHSTPATPPVTTPARQPVTPATPDNTTSSMSSVSPIPLCGFDDPDDTDSE